MNILSRPYLEVKEIGANHFQIDVRFAMFALAASIGAESGRWRAVAHGYRKSNLKITREIHLCLTIARISILPLPGVRGHWFRAIRIWVKRDAITEG
jgi:hypothetical protein